jgi:hypothetical protein
MDVVAGTRRGASAAARQRTRAAENIEKAVMAEPERRFNM